jgi:hypothetical protein
MKSPPVYGTCAYCLEHRQLAKSHAIPDAFFRDIFRKDSGKAVFVSESRGIHTASDSGKAHLLCIPCEGLFAKSLDTPTISFLRSFRKQIETPGSSRRVSFNTDVLARFILSVFWRATLSTSSLYSYSSPSVLNPNHLKGYLLDPTTNPFEVASYLFRNVVDDISGSSSDLLMPPAHAWVRYKGSSRLTLMNAFVVHGFSVEVFFPKLPAIARLKPGRLRRGTELFAPDLPLLKCHGLHMGAMNLMHHHVNGRSSVRD